MLITLLLSVAVTMAVMYRDSEPELPEKIVLRVDLDNGVSDTRSDDPWQKLRGDDSLHLLDLVRTLNAAAEDERVAGIAMRLGSARISLVHAQELREAICAFRARDKFVLAFAETFGSLGNGTTEYYLAAAADEIWMQPSGMVSLLGIGLETPFLRDALDKIGVKPEFQQRHEYKSAVELFTRNSMSEAARESLTDILESWFGQIVSGIAQDRSIAPLQLRNLIDRAPLLAEEAEAAGLIDRFGYANRFSRVAKERAGEDAVLLDIDLYLAEPRETGEDPTQVALIYGIGPIQAGDAENSPLDSETFAARNVANAIDSAARDAAIAAILLRIDSPGGSYVGSDVVRQSVIRAKARGKPVVVSMGKYAASGGYFVSMGANRVIAQPRTMTGSIGVFGGKLATTELWTKLGINWSRAGVGAHAGMWSQIFPFSPSAAERHRAVIDFVYDDFTRKLASDRKLPADRVDAVARGRIWGGHDAKAVGLVDALGGYQTALDEVRRTLDLEPGAPIELTVLPEQLSPFNRLRKALSSGVPITVALMDLVSGGAPDPVESMVKALEPVIGDASTLKPPAGLLQLPPFRLAP